MEELEDERLRFTLRLEALLKKRQGVSPVRLAQSSCRTYSRHGGRSSITELTATCEADELLFFE